MSDAVIDGYKAHVQQLEYQLHQLHASYKERGEELFRNAEEIRALKNQVAKLSGEVADRNITVADLVGQLADSDMQKVYDALGLNDGDRCIGGVEGYAFVQNNAIKLNRERVAELEHQLAVEKGRPSCDSYRDDLLKMMCAMVSSFNPAVEFDPWKVARTAGSAVDKAYAEAAARRR